MRGRPGIPASVAGKLAHARQLIDQVLQGERAAPLDLTPRRRAPSAPVVLTGDPDAIDRAADGADIGLVAARLVPHGAVEDVDEEGQVRYVLVPRGARVGAGKAFA